MKLDAFRDAVLERARAEAAEEVRGAEEEGHRRVEEARRRTAHLLERARREGREAAERATGWERAEASREAREGVLRARRDALQELRERALQRLRSMQGEPAYAELLQRLEAAARAQIGESAEIERNDDLGGIVARSGARRVDYTLPEVLDRVLNDMGEELAGLWT